MGYLEELMASRQASENYANYEGEDSENYDGDEENYDGDDNESYHDDYENATGKKPAKKPAKKPMGKQPAKKPRRTFTALVAPVTTGNAQYRIFGSILGTDDGYNTANNASVSIQESAHSIVKNELLAKNLTIRGIKVSVNNEAQLAQPIVVKRLLPNGQTTTRSIIPANYKVPSQFDGKMVIIGNLDWPLTKYDMLEGTMLVGNNATIQFTVEG